MGKEQCGWVKEEKVRDDRASRAKVDGAASG